MSTELKNVVVIGVGCRIVSNDFDLLTFSRLQATLGLQLSERLNTAHNTVGESIQYSPARHPAQKTTLITQAVTSRMIILKMNFLQHLKAKMPSSIWPQSLKFNSIRGSLIQLSKQV